MDEKMKYRLAAKQDEQQLKQLVQASPSDLRAEIAVARLMLQRAVDQNSPAATALLQTIAKLSQADLQNRLRAHELWEREEVYRFCDRLCNVVMQEVQGLDGYEEIIDRISEEIQNLQREETENE